MRVKMSKQPPPEPTASAVGPCLTVIKIVGVPGQKVPYLLGMKQVYISLGATLL